MHMHKILVHVYCMYLQKLALYVLYCMCRFKRTIVFILIKILLADQIVDDKGLNEIITKYSVMWRSIGLTLGLDTSVLDNIEADHHIQRKCFEVTLTKWMNLDRNNATWRVLELAITNANRADLSLEPLTESKIHTCVLTVCMHVLNFCTYMYMYIICMCTLYPLHYQISHHLLMILFINI